MVGGVLAVVVAARAPGVVGAGAGGRAEVGGRGCNNIRYLGAFHSMPKTVRMEM